MSGPLSPARAQPTDATLRILATAADDGQILEGANVILRPLADDTIFRAGVTDRNGYLEMRDISPQRYRIAVSYLGFRTHRDTLSLQAGRRIYSAELRVATERLDEVTIETERGATKRQAGLQTIRAAELNRIPTPGPSGDLASYLQTLPGVVSVGDRGGQLYVRGGAPSQNRFLVDGLPVVQPFHISSFYSAFPQDIVQSVDLYAGGFGAHYAEAMSSVMDVRLRPGNMQRYTGSASTGLVLTTLRAEGPIVRGDQSLLLSARYSLAEEVAAPLLNRTIPVDFYDVTARYSLQHESTSCNVTALRTHDRGSLGVDRRRELTWSNTVVGGRCFILSERLGHAFSIRGGYTGFKNTAGTAASPEQRASRWRAYLALEQEQTLLGFPARFGLRFTAGKYRALIDEAFVDVQSLVLPQDMVRVHGAVDWQIRNDLTVTTSLAGQVARSTNRPIFDPRLRMTWQAGGTNRREISFAAGLYHQIDQGITDERGAGTVFTVWRPPDEDAPLPRSLQAIAGYRQQMGPSFEASIEGYVQRQQNILVSKWKPEAALETETAQADGLAYGADARLEFRRAPLYAYVGYGWSKVTYEAATDDLGAWIEGTVFSYAPPHDRRHQLNAVSSYTVAGVTASVSWALGTGRPYTQVYGFDLALDPSTQHPTNNPGTALTLFERPFAARLPTYHRLDISAERTFDLTSRLKLDTKLGAINVYDRSNIFYFDVNRLQRVNQSPLLPYVSLTLRAD